MKQPPYLKIAIAPKLPLSPNPWNLWCTVQLNEEVGHFPRDHILGKDQRSTAINEVVHERNHAHRRQEQWAALFRNRGH